MADEPDDLLRRASQGDEDALEVLLGRHLSGLRAFVRLRAGPVIRAKESTSDLVQSVFREILQDAGDFVYRGEVAFRHWLFTTALRKILDRNKFYRRGKRDAGKEARLPRGPSGEDLAFGQCYATLYTPSRDAMAREELERIERAFDRLPERYREIITLARVVGLGHAEIAARLGQSEAYCRTLLSRALARLARVLRDEPDDRRSGPVAEK